MNKAITDGLVLMPPAFADGLDVWSSGDGTPGSDTYAGSGTGAFVPADQDFGGCLEVVKAQSVTRVRYMGETPILPGCYLQVTVRIKAVAGALPSVRISGWPGGAGGTKVNGLPEFAESVALTSYGDVVEVRAIIGTGDRTGVDMTWTGALYGYIGLDLTGPNGGVVRIDDISIEDVTGVFLRDLLGFVDVRDYGAKGDGTTNDADAFEAADADANGRTVLVSDGTYLLANNVSMQSEVKFAGQVVMPDSARLILRRNFDYPSYLDAFGGDEDMAFRKAFQALLNFTDHESLDLEGRRIRLQGPLDMQAVEGTKTQFAVRRVIRNGQFEPQAGPAWDPDVVTSQATYAPASPTTLSNVANIANIQRGSLIEGNGVGREVYVREVNVGAGSLTLSQPLYDAEGTQTFTFTRFKYMLDFSGFNDLSQFVISDVEFQCSGHASGIMLARQGNTFHLRDCFITRPRDRGLTSIGGGCQGMMIDRCNFQSNEMPLRVQDRSTIAFNCNANDVKIRDNRTALFKHFCVIGGSGSTIVGNHWFHGDSETDGVRLGGIIFTIPNVKSIVTGNYVDNNFIEWTNEHSADPALGEQFSFGGLTITGNIFTTNDVADWFNFIVVKPYGPGHYLNGFSCVSNVFRSINGFIDRVESVDTTFADLDYGRMRHVTFEGNVFHAVRDEIANPVSVVLEETVPERVWVSDPLVNLPFGGRVRTIETCHPDGRVADEFDEAVYDAPWLDPEFGPDRDQFRVVWRVPTTGRVRARVRIDNPL